MTVKLNDGFEISNYGSPYFVAELNTSHFGDIEVAKKMILKAKEAGVNCIKLQSWSTDSLYSKSYYNSNPIAKRFIKKFSLNEEGLMELKKFCDKLKVSFASTPYSKKEVDFLVDECKVPFIKIASMELNNLDYIEYIGNKKIPIVLSTGMGDIDEIKKAVKTIEKTGNEKICILHCVSLYPTDDEKMNLNNIIGLREIFKYPIGYSDHSEGIYMPIASVALGAGIIEKHFTLSKSDIGMDNQMATEPDEMKELIYYCNRTYNSMGSKDREVSVEDFKQRVLMRRSIVANRDLNVGDIITRDDIDFKRPGDGIPPNKLDEVLGKTVNEKIEFDHLIDESKLK
jgi:sialic acid synthase SpsE